MSLRHVFAISIGRSWWASLGTLSLLIAGPQNSVQSKVLVTFHGSVPARCERTVHQKLRAHSFALADKTSRVTGLKHARHRFDFSGSNDMKHKVRTRSRTKRLRLFEPIASRLPTRLHRSPFKGFKVVKHKDQEWNKDQKTDRFDHDASKPPTRLRRSPFKAFKVVKHKDQEWNKDQKTDRFDHEASKPPTRLHRSPFKAFKVVKKHISHHRDGSTKGRHKRLTHLCLFY